MKKNYITAVILILLVIFFFIFSVYNMGIYTRPL